MVATLGGTLTLLVGLAVLLLPLLANELSRPRDAAWGAVVLLLGLVLVTCAERLAGAPMLAVLCGGLLVGRLGVEVGQGRWRQLTPEEQQRLWSAERWRSSLQQLGASLAAVLGLLQPLLSLVSRPVAGLGTPRPVTKRWVRPEPASPPDGAEAEAAPTSAEPNSETSSEASPESSPEASSESSSDALVVSGFDAIDALLQNAAPEEDLGEAG
jgi:hypothetical protein